MESPSGIFYVGFLLAVLVFDWGYKNVAPVSLYFSSCCMANCFLSAESGAAWLSQLCVWCLPRFAGSSLYCLVSFTLVWKDFLVLYFWQHFLIFVLPSHFLSKDWVSLIIIVRSKKEYYTRSGVGGNTRGALLLPNSIFPSAGGFPSLWKSLKNAPGSGKFRKD